MDRGLREVWVDCAPTINGYCVVDGQGKEPELVELCTPHTHNELEYLAIIAGLLKGFRGKHCLLRVYSDSRLAVNQILNKWKVKERRFIPYVVWARGLCSMLNKQGCYPELVWIPRWQNEAGKVVDL